MGDPAGVGGEITLMAWRALCETGPAFAIVDDPDRLRRLSRALALDAPIVVIDGLDQAALHFRRGLPVLPVGAAVTTAPARPDETGALASITALEAATALTLAGEARAIVTNPIHKKGVYGEDFPYPGQTEFLADAAGAPGKGVMMIVGPSLRTVPVTIHIPLRAVADALSVDRIKRVGLTVAHALKDDFGIETPVLGVCGLNPHAGEDGAIGTEDRSVVAHGVAQLQAAGVDAKGPLPADTLFHERARARFDAVLGMYHDQALIPVKALHFDEAVNVTLGLSIVRTSPDHGTAFDLAGRGLASPQSLIAAIRLAGHMADAREARRMRRLETAR